MIDGLDCLRLQDPPDQQSGGSCCFPLLVFQKMGCSVILGLETSCDETAAAVVDSQGQVLSSVLESQVKIHARYGGVVPELASRRHVESLEGITQEALIQARVSLNDLSGIAVTNRPGLIGALIVGLNFGKALAYAANVPYVTVNHLEGHVASAWLANPSLPTPTMILIASGGHTHLACVTQKGDYRFIGKTMDDAAGEAFDKGAKMLSLPYPGGPAIDKLAKQGRRDAVAFPRPRIHSADFDFSFSGLKTSLLYFLRNQEGETSTKVAVEDLAASYQEAIVEVLVEKLCRAAKHFGASAVSIVGGVAANSRLRDKLYQRAGEEGLMATLPPLALCTDNAAMIAAAGWEKVKRREWASWDADAYSTLQCKQEFLDSNPSVMS